MKISTTLKYAVPTQPHLSRRDYPLVIKYMGSKARLIDFVVEGLQDAYREGPVCDLFAGACSLSGAIGHSARMISNDIQSYSKTIATTYLHRMTASTMAISGEDIVSTASEIANTLLKGIPSNFFHPRSASLEEFNEIEKRNRSLLEHTFNGPHHLFIQYYSGTWWSAEQCAWIDALREVADGLLASGEINKGDHSIVLTCIMHSMAYCGQGTGHFAQYRDAKTASSLADINLYRQKSIATHFSRKYEAIKQWNSENVPQNNDYELHTLGFEDCLTKFSEGTVYADPPYAFVHYSRFYHALETFVLYDYPELQIKGGEIVKGRYREGRHQSPFSIRSQVPGAFERMFSGITNNGSNLVLSYSNSGLFDLLELFDLVHDCLGMDYDISVLNKDHTHMTMGRRADRDRVVEEALIVAKKR